MKKLIFVVCALLTANISAMETKKKPDEFIITKAYQPSERQFLVDSLILDPKTAFDTTQKINNLFVEKIEQQNLREKSALEVWKIVKELRAQYEQQSPIFSLSECTQEQGGLCGMSREVRPHRAQFERKVAQTLVEKLKKNKKVEFAAFGCGKLFPELVILTNVLAQNPQAQLDVHCIDKNYVPYCEAKTLFTKNNKKQEVILQDPIDPKIMLTPLIELIKKHPDFKNDELLISQPFFEELFIQEMRFEQMFMFLQKTFPKARLNIIPHGSRSKYMFYCQQNKSVPDLITAIDIDDAQSKERGSMRDYLLLCAETLKKNPTTANLLLGRAENDPCMSISLQNGPNARKVPIENEQEKIELYLTALPF